jgi:hypothetical protein
MAGLVFTVVSFADADWNTPVTSLAENNDGEMFLLDLSRLKKAATLVSPTQLAEGGVDVDSYDSLADWLADAHGDEVAAFHNLPEGTDPTVEQLKAWLGAEGSDYLTVVNNGVTQFTKLSKSMQKNAEALFWLLYEGDEDEDDDDC